MYFVTTDQKTPRAPYAWNLLVRTSICLLCLTDAFLLALKPTSTKCLPVAITFQDLRTLPCPVCARMYIIVSALWIG